MRLAPPGGYRGDTFDSFGSQAILPLVQRPSRYGDGELNLANEGFREGLFNVLLVFPDVYEIGMSHQGIRFLYHRLAATEGVGVELAFAPWPDAEKLMRAVGEPFRSLRTGTPARRFDLIGLSITYELHYTNVLMVLDLAGLPLEASERREDDPIVLSGGPCCTNPLPFLRAIDAVFLGDAEDSLPEAVAALSKLKAVGAPRKARREMLARIEGVFVAGVTSAAKARTYRFEAGDLPRRPIVPSSEVVHERLSIEIMRGCARGCRFCHAGIFYRPCRERSVDEIVDATIEGLDWTGWDEVSLLSLSTSDYSRLEELLVRLVPELERRKVSLALPSLRPETITREIVAASSIVTKSGFTLAPEAGTERLRRVIKKDFSDEDILQGVAKILQGGWQALKLYFMIGLPTETEEDLAGIAGLIDRILGLPRRRGRFNLSVSISPFVPKPHTPFQWERQCSIEEFRAKEEYLAKRIRSRFVTLSLRDPRVSILEGVLARGDERLWPALRRAFDLGCRFDSWMDELRFDLWEQALLQCGLDIAALTAARPLEQPLPWDSFELHATKSVLSKERERAYSGDAAGSLGATDAAGDDLPGKGTAEEARETVGQEFRGACEDVARAEELISSTVAGREPASEPVPEPAHPASDRPIFRYRFVYEKAGRERFLSHIETMNVIQRALRRSKLPLYFTEGFHPRPRVSAGPSLAVGMEGEKEFFDIELLESAEPSPELLNHFLPAGIRVKAVGGPFARKVGKLPTEARFRYNLSFEALTMMLKSAGAPSEMLSENERMWYLLGEELGLPESFGSVERGAPADPRVWLEAEWVRMFETSASFKDEKGRERFCAGCAVLSRNQYALELVIPGAEGAPRPQDLLRILLPKGLASLVRIRRLEILYKHEDKFVDPLHLIESRHPET